MVFDSGQGISATVAPETSFLSSRLKKARYKNGDLWQAYHAFFKIVIRSISSSEISSCRRS